MCIELRRADWAPYLVNLFPQVGLSLITHCSRGRAQPGISPPRPGAANTSPAGAQFPANHKRITRSPGLLSIFPAGPKATATKSVQCQVSRGFLRPKSRRCRTCRSTDSVKIILNILGQLPPPTNKMFTESTCPCEQTTSPRV